MLAPAEPAVRHGTGRRGLVARRARYASTRLGPRLRANGPEGRVTHWRRTGGARAHAVVAEAVEAEVEVGEAIGGEALFGTRARERLEKRSASDSHGRP